jgi:hypothetical protein
MGEVKGWPFLMTGRAGDYIFKNFGEKTFFSRRPKPYDRKRHPNSRKTQDKFAQIVPLAKFINKIPELKNIWKNANIKGRRAFNRVVIYNMNNVKEDRLTEKNIITPPGLKLEVKELIVKDFTINPYLEIMDGFLSSPLQAVVVVYAYNSGNENKKDFLLFAVTQEILGAADENRFNIIFTPKLLFINTLSIYNKWIMYFTLIKDDPLNLIWTSTAAFSGSNGLHEIPASFCLDERSKDFFFNRFLEMN